MVTASAPTAPLLAMRSIEKSFPGVKALKGIDLTLHRGEVLALMGENGAGKSTLIKVLAGVHQPEDGTITLDGDAVAFASPLDAQAQGIAVIYQEFNLIPHLTVRENILLGHEQSRFGFVNKAEERQRVHAVLHQMGVRINPEAVCSTLSVAEQQLVEIAKALSVGARLLVMDEPSAALTNQEVEALFSLIADLKAQGIGIIYISHRLDEIYAIADRVTVLRDGSYIGTEALADVSREQLIEMMVGRSLENEFPKAQHPIGEVRLKVDGLMGLKLSAPVSFEIRSGEVVGLTGLVGAGRTELARLIFGADRATSGRVSLDGKPLTIHSPRDAIQAGICLLTEDRKAQGLVLGRSARENFALGNMSRWSNFGWLDQQHERSTFGSYIDSLKIKVAGQEQRAQHLSGGNQQKVLLARWLEANTDVLIFDEPTRGIDVGAKYEIYLLINRLAEQGKAILMISSELPEILGMSDRILVMHEGRLRGEVTDVAGASQEQLLAMAVG
ncbi:MAG: ribose ABC transporter ATP-binding protein RbsA [Rhodothermales bacterium]